MLNSLCCQLTELVLKETNLVSIPPSKFTLIAPPTSLSKFEWIKTEGVEK